MGIIAFVAVIGFSMATCDDGNSNGNNGGGDTNPFVGTWMSANGYVMVFDVAVIANSEFLYAYGMIILSTKTSNRQLEANSADYEVSGKFGAIERKPGNRQKMQKKGKKINGFLSKLFTFE